MPMTIFWRYFYTSFFTSRRDGVNVFCLSVCVCVCVCCFVLLSCNKQFVEILCFQEFCLWRPRKGCYKYWQRIIQKNLRGAETPPYEAAPLPHTKVGAKCLSAVVLDNLDRAAVWKQTNWYVGIQTWSWSGEPAASARDVLWQANTER